MRLLRSRRFGHFIQANSLGLLVFLLGGLLLLCIALKNIRLDTELNSWLQRSSRIDAEIAAANPSFDPTVSQSSNPLEGSHGILLTQTARRPGGADMISVDALMVHLEALAIAKHVTVDLFDVSWGLKDICITPTAPDYGGPPASLILEHMMPCAIKTPLDCFWEGAKIHNPDHPVRLGSFGPQMSWSTLNPLRLIEDIKRNHPHATFSYASIINWMHRVGVSSGYQEKPCLDPTDPNCPPYAPNKFNKKPLNIGELLADGCRGFAAKQMHWRQEEIVGGITLNSTGHIVKAAALQSTIQLMGSHDLYDWWRRDNRVQDVNNWSQEKARLILESWQKSFKEELTRFTRTSASSRAYSIHAITPKTMVEPIETRSLLDYTNLLISYIPMTVIFLCSHTAHPMLPINSETDIGSDISTSPLGTTNNRLRTLLLAIVLSCLVFLTFVASLGLSSFMNLPINMATTYLLGPLTLCYGFNQFNTMANVYSRLVKQVSFEDLTSECLHQSLPVIMIESATCILALMVSAIIPIAATRVFAQQAINSIILITVATIFVVPSLIIAFLATSASKNTVRPTIRTVSASIDGFGSRKRKSSIGRRGAKTMQNDGDDGSLEEQIFSRIRDDLEKIRSDSATPTDINFSAELNADGFKTSFALKARPRPLCTPIKPTPDVISDIPLRAKFSRPNTMPDILESVFQSKNIVQLEANDQVKPDPPSRVEPSEEGFITKIANTLTTNTYVKTFVCLLKLCIIVLMIMNISNVRYGLHVRDIIAKDTDDYLSLQAQDTYFPVHNIFIITKGNFDYATNQRLLYDMHKAILQVDAIVNDGRDEKFWLIYFRNWLREIQNEFDLDRNKSLISNDGWTAEASEASKIAYKLLVQTGKTDNPIDKSIAETNRLVDSDGIINPRGFYYYLGAWVLNDAFTYASSEANFKPEPKTWSDNEDSLKVDKARSLVHSQIPFLMKLTSDNQALSTIISIRNLSQLFDQLGISNFPSGIPFIYWDQFIQLDLLLYLAMIITAALIYLIVYLITLDLSIAAIITIPILMSPVELYCLIGYLGLPMNNIIAVLLIMTLGFSTVQTVHLAIYFKLSTGDPTKRVARALRHKLPVILTGLALFFTCPVVFVYSKFDFITNYSHVLFGLLALNAFNSLLLTPVILTIYGSVFKNRMNDVGGYNTSQKKDLQTERKKKGVKKIKIGKKSYPKIQSEISLSTISEEPQSDMHLHDLKLDFSIKCYR